MSRASPNGDASFGCEQRSAAASIGASELMDRDVLPGTLRHLLLSAFLCGALGAAAQTGAPEAFVEPQELPLPDGEPPAGVGNAEVLEMVAAEFSDEMIAAVIAANPPRFDVSPRALVALKNSGASERVIEAMLAAETAAQTADAGPATPLTPPSAELVKLTAMIEHLAAQQEAVVASRREASRVDPAPRAWLVEGEERTITAPTIAQVAFAGGKRGERFKTLQGLANQALAFANPAVSGIATTIGSLFRPEGQRTAVWALAARASTRVLDDKPVFEIDFAHIPGVDPDRYQPAYVQLVPTNDNYRLVAAAETGGDERALPDGPIIEEIVATLRTPLGRGQYRVEPAETLGPGEYALVLRPIPETRRERRRNAQASLGELLGGGTSQILYLTWEFSVAATPR